MKTRSLRALASLLALLMLLSCSLIACTVVLPDPNETIPDDPKDTIDTSALPDTEEITEGETSAPDTEEVTDEVTEPDTEATTEPDEQPQPEYDVITIARALELCGEESGHITDESGNKVTLYCSSGKQYGFLKQFAGQEVTMELAACNWNNKTFWAGCVLSVITEDGKVVNSLNFDNN